MITARLGDASSHHPTCSPRGGAIMALVLLFRLQIDTRPATAMLQAERQIIYASSIMNRVICFLC